jgi:hypothetical protein
MGLELCSVDFDSSGLCLMDSDSSGLYPMDFESLWLGIMSKSKDQLMERPTMSLYGYSLA